MRWTVVVALVVAALTVGGADDPRVRESTMPAAERVRAAALATLAKGTARFVVECRAAWDGGSFTLRRDGVYDARAERASLTQTARLDGGGALAPQFAYHVRPGKETAYAVVDREQGYLRLPSWPAPIRERWKEYTDTSNIIGVSADVEAVPTAVEMLVRPRGGTRDGGTYHVDVVPFAAAYGVPTQCMANAFDGDGFSLLRFPHDVRAAVEIRHGLVTTVTYDLIEVYRTGWRRAENVPGDVRATLRSVRTTVTLTDHGAPVTIPVPAGRDLVSDDEMRAHGPSPA